MILHKYVIMLAWGDVFVEPAVAPAGLHTIYVCVSGRLVQLTRLLENCGRFHNDSVVAFLCDGLFQPLQ